MKPEAFEFLKRFALVLGVLYVVYGIRIAIAYKEWLECKNSWGVFWKFRNRCKANGFDWAIETLTVILFCLAILIWVMSPIVNC